MPPAAVAIPCSVATSTFSASALASGSPTAIVWIATPFCAATRAAAFAALVFLAYAASLLRARLRRPRGRPVPEAAA